MDSQHKSEMNIRNDNAVAFPRQEVYGIASSGVVSEAVAGGSESLTLTGHLNYLFTEYFKGLLFVALSSVFILAIPSILSRQGSLKTVLTDIVKRMMDIVGAVVGLLLTSPLWLIIPILIRIDSPGPVFYTQTRVGVDRRKRSRRVYQKADIDDRRSRDRRREDYHGSLFKVIKFRTMVNNAERNSGPVWATKNDARITGIGKVLRKTRMDEIPQFLNVLVGDMALVGPRPERPEFVADLSEKVKGYRDRLQVRPGLTGLAQVENGYDSCVSSVVKKVEYDLTYIKNRSIWLDIKILLKTVFVVITGKGAH